MPPGLSIRMNSPTTTSRPSGRKTKSLLTTSGPTPPCTGEMRAEMEQAMREIKESPMPDAQKEQMKQRIRSQIQAMEEMADAFPKTLVPRAIPPLHAVRILVINQIPCWHRRAWAFYKAVGSRCNARSRPFIYGRFSRRTLVLNHGIPAGLFCLVKQLVRLVDHFLQRFIAPGCNTYAHGKPEF